MGYGHVCDGAKRPNVRRNGEFGFDFAIPNGLQTRSQRFPQPPSFSSMTKMAGAGVKRSHPFGMESLPAPAMKFKRTPVFCDIRGEDPSKSTAPSEPNRYEVKSTENMRLTGDFLKLAPPATHLGSQPSAFAESSFGSRFDDKGTIHGQPPLLSLFPAPNKEIVQNDQNSSYSRKGNMEEKVDLRLKL
ncbi:OLC1v1008241C1 [Oldenlandia corymbosa var. corymbosa]|uniref:OLC1v1008241C1 n=1 Tax=Oldenlandia corymbosa var. corymbosa TaxID=529605 RepID=A0AAV1DL67_OLDCO|nr:OLC1v1008241C1 [Oldenlandia corymbosa var. corymbosa]